MRVWDTYAQKNHNLHRHRSSEGYFQNIPQGAVRVELREDSVVAVIPWVMLAPGGIQCPG